MNHGTDATESIDIRRALDRLQGTLEEFSDRFRELRRDRRQMHEYISELERELKKAERTASEHGEAGEAERGQIDELQERIRAGERRQAELLARISELDQAVRERESLVAEQEDLIQQYQARFDDARDFASRSDVERRELEETLARLKAEAESARAAEREARARTAALEAQLAQGGSADAAGQVEALSAQLASMRQTLQVLESERAELVTKHTRLAEEFEAARRSEKAAVERALQLESEWKVADETARLRDAAASELEKRVVALQAELETASTRLRDTDSDGAEVGRARLLEEELERSRAEVAELKAKRSRAAVASDSVGAMSEQERAAMVAQIQSAIGVIDRYLSEA